MKFFTRLSPLATSILALSMAVFLAFWGLSAPTASAGDGFWQTSGSPGACDFLQVPGDPYSPIYICADWITQGETQLTCCITEDPNLRGGTVEDCLTVMTTDERPGL